MASVEEVYESLGVVHGDKCNVCEVVDTAVTANWVVSIIKRLKGVN